MVRPPQPFFPDRPLAEWFLLLFLAQAVPEPLNGSILAKVEVRLVRTQVVAESILSQLLIFMCSTLMDLWDEFGYQILYLGGACPGWASELSRKPL
ncbi:MAG: hypothetical protein J07HN6_01570 [Halonotius sp. J07HN6]|nr:MAG: hypothetical protein J07HN6_01570 [Halonotius sp. J07HN6]ERH05447.1 MAG: hypothetical protein J07HN4v3_01045 [Halonotius sp. J07HN4]